MKRLGIEYHGEISYTSNHFEYLIKRCEEFILKGLAYCDDTPHD